MDIKKEAEKAYPELVELRRYFHSHPEVSEQELHTMDAIEKKLEEYGIPSVRVPSGGVLGIIDSGRPGWTVLLRADIDALPIEEDPCNLARERACISQNPGVMHACGHDGHVAMELAEGRILEEYKAEWDGRVILMFEEGEENGSGCVYRILRYLEEHQLHVDVCYATHVIAGIPTGKVMCGIGPVLTGAFAFQVSIHGRGGHGSRPDLAVSPLDCFTAFYQDMQSVRMRKISPEDCLTFSVGTVHTGDAANVIPETLHFSGTCRYFEEESGHIFRNTFWDDLDSICRRYGCTWKAEKEDIVIPTVNHAVCADMLSKAVRENLGEEALLTPVRSMPSESMGVTLAVYPGVMTFTGIQNEAWGSGAGHHTPQFDIDERGLITGVAAALAYTLTMLKEKPKLDFTPRSLDELERK